MLAKKPYRNNQVKTRQTHNSKEARINPLPHE